MDRDATSFASHSNWWDRTSQNLEVPTSQNLIRECWTLRREKIMDLRPYFPKHYLTKTLPHMAIPTAFASSSTSPLHGNPNSYVYDVFLNHRGPDVKKTLASHIYRGLEKHGIRVFLDKHELQEGEKMTPQIEGAIRTASVHVAIFSPTYAESSWCLKELVLMLESRSTVIPVFYNVKPSDLRWARGGDGVYARSLGMLEKKKTRDCDSQPRYDSTIGKWWDALSAVFSKKTRDCDSQPRYDSDTIGKWRDALSAVADISGFELEACNG